MFWSWAGRQSPVCSAKKNCSLTTWNKYSLPLVLKVVFIVNSLTGDSKNISITCWVRWNVLHILFHRKCPSDSDANEHGARLY